MSDSQPSPSSSVAIKSSVAFNKVYASREGVQIVELKLEQNKLGMGTSNIPPREPDGKLLRVIQKVSTFSNLTIFLSDINAKHRRLQHRDSNTRGRFLMQAVGDDRIRYLGPHFHNFFAGGHWGTQDAILSNKFLYLHHLITQGLPTTSDHVPVVMTVSARPTTISIRERFSSAQADWYLYN